VLLAEELSPIDLLSLRYLRRLEIERERERETERDRAERFLSPFAPTSPPTPLPPAGSAESASFPELRRSQAEINIAFVTCAPLSWEHSAVHM